MGNPEGDRENEEIEDPMALNAFVGPCPPSSPAMQGPRH